MRGAGDGRGNGINPNADSAISEDPVTESSVLLKTRKIWSKAAWLEYDVGKGDPPLLQA
jgi:hypothetical protein